MSVTLLSTPTRIIGGIDSNVLGAISQAPFEFQAVNFAFPNYKIEINVLDENDLPYFEVVFKYSPRPDGYLFVNLGEIVTEVNKRRGSLATRFKVGYAESYTGSVEPVFTIIGEWLAVYAEKQLLSIGGANMYEAILDTSILAIPLTVFKNPVFWEGFERTFSFIMDSNYNTRTGLTFTRIRAVRYDINKNPLGEVFGIEDTDLTPRLVLNRVINVVDPYVGISVSSLSQELLYEKQSPCINPVMIDWVNSLGGVDQWLFTIDQDYSREAEQGLIFQSAINEDIQNVNRTKGRISNTWTQQIILRAENLKLDQLKALAEIKSSISVRIWLNNSGSEWVGTIVSSQYSTIHASNNSLHEFTLQVELPSNFDINKAINYAEDQIEVLIDSDGEDLIDLDTEILIG